VLKIMTLKDAPLLTPPVHFLASTARAIISHGHDYTLNELPRRAKLAQLIQLG
jgi:hypothetical protein